jgi:hypothetical protein
MSNSSNKLKTNLGMKCRSTTECKESYLQCLKIDKNNKVDICDKNNVNCGSADEPTGVCYPSSIEAGSLKKLEYIDEETIKREKAQKKKREEDKKKREEMLGMVIGIGIGAIVVILGGRWAFKYVKKRMKNENE